ncbi:hypothetical protein J2S13_003273 [Oikeobacillus pervagus]|uniref:Uncharacterized protein n=1 Tax=Oikeobacillus pervagus TaxID=1325931 RepID=A0AAJ1T4U8_9BACI|nr:hypothetical protein [Oikeobacillus pervagus]MDQ0216787.1 hypothetical protein [Oikeobacillus pervagus]
MKLYEKPIHAYLHQDLVAYDSDDNDRQLIYYFKKGYVTVLGEFESDQYVTGKAHIIFNQTDVISVEAGLLRLINEEGNRSSK